MSFHFEDEFDQFNLESLFNIDENAELTEIHNSKPSHAKFSSHFDGLLGHANILLARGQREEAKAILKAIISGEENFIPAYESLIDLLEFEGEMDNALELKLKLFEMTSKHPAEKIESAADQCAELGRINDAVKLYRKMCTNSGATREMILKYSEFVYQYFSNIEKLVLHAKSTLLCFDIATNKTITKDFDEQIFDFYSKKEFFLAEKLLFCLGNNCSREFNDDRFNLLIEILLYNEKYGRALYYFMKFRSLTLFTVSNEKIIDEKFGNEKFIIKYLFDSSDNIFKFNIDSDLHLDLKLKLFKTFIGLKLKNLISICIDLFKTVSIDDYSDLITDISQNLASKGFFLACKNWIENFFHLDQIQNSSLFAPIYFDCLVNLNLDQEAIEFGQIVLTPGMHHQPDYDMLIKYHNLSQQDEHFLSISENIYSQKNLDEQSASVLLHRLKIFQVQFNKGDSSHRESMQYFDCLCYALLFDQQSLSIGLKEDPNFFFMNRPKAKNRIESYRENYKQFHSNSIVNFSNQNKEIELFVRNFFLKDIFLLSNYLGHMQLYWEQLILLSSAMLNKDIVKYPQLEPYLNFLYMVICFKLNMMELFGFYLRNYQETVNNRLSIRALHLIYIATQDCGILRRAMLASKLNPIQPSICIGMSYFASRSYATSMNYYLELLNSRESECNEVGISEILWFMIAICFINLTRNRRVQTAKTEYLLSSAVAILKSKYFNMRRSDLKQEIFYNMARFYHSIESFTLAAHFYNKAINCPPKSVEYNLKLYAVYNLSILYQHNGCYNASMQLYTNTFFT